MTNDHLGVCRSAPPSFFRVFRPLRRSSKGVAPALHSRRRELGGAAEELRPTSERYPRQKSKGASRLYFAVAKSPPGKYAPLTFVSAPSTCFVLSEAVFSLLGRIRGLRPGVAHKLDISVDVPRFFVAEGLFICVKPLGLVVCLCVPFLKPCVLGFCKFFGNATFKTERLHSVGVLVLYLAKVRRSIDERF